jgi:hypothetical protein
MCPYLKRWLSGLSLASFLLLSVSACGISSFRCEIETDEELLNRVIKEVIENGPTEGR